MRLTWVAFFIWVKNLFRFRMKEKGGYAYGKYQNYSR